MKKKNIKIIIYSSALRATIFFLRMARVFGSRKRKGFVIVLPPAGPGSLGDEAILKGFIRHKERATKKFCIITYGNHFYNYLSCQNIGFLNMEKFLCQGSWKGKFSLVRAVAKFDEFYCLGTDVLDGFYSEDESLRRLEVVKLAVNLGLACSVIGFSFNDSRNMACINAFRRLPKQVKLCCRDKESAERLSRVTDRFVAWTGDLAFLSRPEFENDCVKKVRNWIGSREGQGCIFMGININFLHIKHFLNQDGMVRRYCEILNFLKEKNKKLNFVFISHDSRGDVNDYTLAERVYEHLGDGVKSDCYFVSHDAGADEVKAICGFLDAVFTGRFHLAIACLGQGTPVSIIDYQGKVYGIASFVGINNYVVSMEQLVRGSGVFNVLSSLINDRSEVRKIIQQVSPKLVELAKKNFE